jgi:hypothetical protein
MKALLLSKEADAIRLLNYTTAVLGSNLCLDTNYLD